MPEKRRKFDREFREDAVRIGWESSKPIAQVARDLTAADWQRLRGAATDLDDPDVMTRAWS